jgi:hypothetical protein
MSVTDVTFGVQDIIQWHAAKLQKIDFLFIEPRNFMFGIGQANERNVFIFPETLKLLRVIRPNCQNDCAAYGELLIFITQARQLRATVRSHEAAQKIKYHGPAAKLRQANVPALYIIQFKIGRGVSRCDQPTHSATILLLSPKYRRTFSKSIFPSMCFVDSGDKSTVTSDQSSVHTLRHVQISIPGFLLNTS